MSKVTIDFKELAELRQQVQQAEIKEQQHLLNEFLEEAKGQLLGHQISHEKSPALRLWHRADFLV